VTPTDPDTLCQSVPPAPLAWRWMAGVQAAKQPGGLAIW
jgi:hypothetical protein